MNFRRNFIWILPLLVIVSSPVWWSVAGLLLKPRGDLNSPVPPPTDKARSFVLNDVLLTQYRDGRDDFILKAARVNTGIRADLLEMEKIEARLLAADGRTSLLTGNKGLYDTGQQIITVLDNVRLETIDGRVMQTEELNYLVKERKVKTSGDVLVTGEKLKAAGGNLSYDLVDGAFLVGDGVKVDLY